MLPISERRSDLAPTPRHLSILGSTGSIGTQTLEVVRLFDERFVIEALTAGSNVELLVEQALEFRPSFVVIGDTSQVARVERELAGTEIQVLSGAEGLKAAATAGSVDLVVAAVVGFAGLVPVVEAVRSGKDIALANKETLVVGGRLIRALAERSGARVLPVDSEHSAIFQCLVGERLASIENLVLTASGGPFRERPRATFHEITRAEALDHPNWSMGPKITVDSASMMNKGLEVIEARWLFDLSADQIQILVHPQSVVHSMVTFRDGAIKAQLGVPDMKVPIQYALTFPERWDAPHDRLDWQQLRELTFEQPDADKFPCLRLAYEALEAGGTAPAVLNAANEEAVARFLNEEIGFTDIPYFIEETLARLEITPANSLELLQTADESARRTVTELTAPLTN
jgi:1-deoxy-D-xylulose-5-phosphate reductoisomerase